MRDVIVRGTDERCQRPVKFVRLFTAEAQFV
jgi:hypothetical protein